MPALVNHIIAQVVLTRKNGLPVDSIVNTLHFERLAGDFHTNADELLTVISATYNDTHTPATGGIRAYLNSTIAKTPDACFVNFYDGSLPPGERTPYKKPFSIGSGAESGALPDEVAACISFRKAPGTAAGAFASQRGRLFIGPLDITACQGSDASDTRPSTSFQETLRYSFKFLHQLALSDCDSAWCVYSPKLNKLFTVDEVWTDNAFDTQRRRGIKATARTYLSTSIGG